MVNRLAGQSSPYLRQHKDNPVDWYPWGPEALRAAAEQNKPILLSVGYAACHWCHVMAHESFEDPDTARLMNENFINVKVDREERPDLDAVYQGALSLMRIPGGWPLTMFLAPDGRPFAGGTYFPPVKTYGRPSFTYVLNQISEIWRDQPESAAKSSAVIMEYLGRIMAPAEDGALTEAVFADTANSLLEQIDPVHGGFGGAPKFPQTAALELLWRHALRTGDKATHHAVTNTLTRICQGGIYDHLGGGFARYTVDAEWLVPHFEKMLYDNALLLGLMTQVWCDTRDPLLAARIEETIGWARREMRVDGGFAASLDADSEGEEGKFYLWTLDEITAVLGAEEAGFLAPVYGVTPQGNFEGRSILNRLDTLSLRGAADEARLHAARQRLLAARAARQRPERDDKLLTDWNALFCLAIVKAGMAFQRQDWISFGIDTHKSLLARQSTESAGELYLLHASLGDTDGPAGMAEDYANLIACGLALYEATGEEDYLRDARRLAATLEGGFALPEGGFSQSPHTARDVIVPVTPIYDAAVPPANGMMADAYARLYALTGDEDFRRRAEGLFDRFGGLASKVLGAAPTFMNGFDTFISGPVIVLCPPRGGPEDWTADPLAAAAFALPDPGRTILWHKADTPLPPGHPAYGKAAQDGKLTAYICRGRSCSLPIVDAAQLVLPPASSS